MAAFSSDNDTDLTELVSSGGLSVWNSCDLVHLTPTAYGDLAENLLKLVANSTTESGQAKPRRRIESIFTRATEPAATGPTPGWIMGHNRSEGGRGGPGRGFGGQGGCGRQPGWSKPLLPILGPGAGLGIRSSVF